MPHRTSIAAAIALALAAGCATASSRHAAAEPTLAQTITAQLAKEDGIPWSDKRPLTWADFKGPAPSGSGVVAAETAYTIIHGFRCIGSKFDYRVVAAFRPRDSWVRPALLRTPADSARALRHEQTHFDVSEVHARRLRRYLAEVMAPCYIPTGDLSSMASRIERDEKAAQELYDRETDHGRAPTVQARWDKDIDSQLLALGKFARQP